MKPIIGVFLDYFPHRTPSQCYMQSSKLVVDLTVSGECERPRKAYQMLTNGVADSLNCPLGDYIRKLDSNNIVSTIKWYRVSYCFF